MKGFVSFKLDGGGRIGLSVFSIASYNSCYSNECTCIRTTDGEKHTVKSSFADVEKALVSAMEDVSAVNRSEKLHTSDVTANVWIPVENGLPAPMEDVQVAYVRDTRYADCIAYLDADGWVNSYNCTHMNCVVTHWRPIDTNFIPGGTR